MPTKNLLTTNATIIPILPKKVSLLHLLIVLHAKNGTAKVLQNLSQIYLLK